MRYATLAGAQVAVGAAAIFARFALTGASPLAVAAARLVIASGLLLLIAAVSPRQARGRSIPHDGTRASRIIFVVAGFALAVHFATWIWSLEYTSVAISTLLVSTTPIWAALYETLSGKHHLSAAAWGALAAGIAGLFLVAGFNATRAPHSGHMILGCALALAGAIAIGAYFMLIREIRVIYGTRAIVTRTYSWAALVLVVAAAVGRQAPPSIHAHEAWGGILAMALVSQLLGHTAMNAALRWFTASAVALSTLLEPVIAALLALAIFGERLTPQAWAGGLLILIAIGVFLRLEPPESVV